MNCKDCNKLFLEIDEYRNTRARCLLKVPPKKGKIITWAMTTFIVPGVVSKYGDYRVKVEMENKKKAPIWCPLNNKKGEIKVEK